MGAYVFDNAWERERERLAGIEEHLDPGTTRHLRALGVGAGWTCLEVAGGGGSITRWLCARVRPSGRVVATDLDTRFLDAIGEPNLEVRRHDIVADDLPGEQFDLIHARLLLEHLPERDLVLKKMITALRPGGWLVIEDCDWRGLLAEPPLAFFYPVARADRAVEVWRGIVAAMQVAGYDAQYGWRLPAEMLAHGLLEAGAEARAPMMRGRTVSVAAPRFTLEHLRERLVQAGALTNDQIDEEIRWLDDPDSVALPFLLVAAWGRRPGTAPERTAPENVIPAQPKGSMADRLRDAALFAACTREELSAIAQLAVEVQASAGRVLTQEGEPGCAFYLIENGMAAVTRQGRRLTTLGPGSFFGEMALLDRGPRTATVTADTAMKLLAFDEGGFAALLGKAPAVARKILEVVAERLRNAEDALSH